MADLSLSERGNNRWALRETKECSGQGVIPSISNPPQKIVMGVNVRRGKKPSHAMRSITIFQPSYYTYFLYPHLVDLFSTWFVGPRMHNKGTKKE